jgi:hypothetical protein
LWIAVIAAFLTLCTAGFVEGRNYNNRSRGPVKPIENPPPMVESVDTSGMSFKVVDGRTVNIYTVTNFTQFTINGRAGKFEDLKTGMKVSVTASGTTASRVDAEDYAGSDSGSKPKSKK